MALAVSPLLVGVAVWLLPSLVILVVLAVTRALDHLRSAPRPRRSAGYAARHTAA